jgi:hypothetical protein
MDDKHNMERRAGRLPHQAVDDRDADRTKAGFISEAKANVERPIPYHSPERLQYYLLRIGYCIITRQFADARAVDGGDRRKEVQINRTSYAVRARPSRLLPHLSFAFGFTHRIALKI